MGANHRSSYISFDMFARVFISITKVLVSLWLSLTIHNIYDLKGQYVIIVARVIYLLLSYHFHSLATTYVCM